MSGSNLEQTLRAISLNGSPQVRASSQPTRRSLEDVVKELESHSYRVRDTYAAHDETGAQTVVCKCEDNLGSQVFVEVAEPVAVPSATVRSVPENNFTLSRKLGVLDAAGPAVSGAVLENGRDICILRRAGSQPTEQTFTRLSTEQKAPDIFNGSANSYPLIRNLEISIDKQAALTIIREASARMRAKEFLLASQDFMETEAVLEALHRDFAVAANEIKRHMEAIDNSILDVESSFEHYAKHPPCKESELAKFQQIPNELRLYHRLMETNLRVAGALNSLRPDLLHMKADIDAAMEVVEREAHCV